MTSLTSTTAHPAPHHAAGRALARAVGSLPWALVFAAGYGPAVAMSAALQMALAEQATGGRFDTVVLVMLGAAAAAGAVAWVAAAAVAGHRPFTARFAAMLIALTLSTAAAIALCQYAALVMYAFRHETADIASPMHWIVHQIGPMAKAAYITVAAGLRLILPTGILPLFAGVTLFAWRTRRAG